MALATRTKDQPSALRLIPGGRPVSGASETRASETGSSDGALATPFARERDDAELVALTRAGEKSAFEALYRRHSPYALALSVRVQGNAHDIEDIVHDSFLKAHDRIDDLRSGHSFRAWLSSVIVREVRTRMRRRRMLSLLGIQTADPVDLDALVSPEAGPEVRAILAEVYQILREVSVDERICWTLRYVEGRKLEEVASLTGCSLATAKRRIASVQEKILVLESAAPKSEGRAP